MTEQNFKIHPRRRKKLLQGLSDWRQRVLALKNPRHGDYVYMDQLECFPKFRFVIPIKQREWIVYAFMAFDILQKEFAPLEDFTPYLKIELACSKYKRLLGNPISYHWVRNRLRLHRPPKIYYTLKPGELSNKTPLIPQNDWKFLLKGGSPLQFFGSDFYDEYGKDFYTDIIAIPVADLRHYQLKDGQGALNLPS